VAISVDDPFFSQPAWSPLQPHVEYTEIESEERVTLALIVARCFSIANRRTMRLEVVRAPRHFVAHWGRMIDTSELVAIVEAGWTIEVEPFEVHAGLLDVLPSLAEQLEDT